MTKVAYDAIGLKCLVCKNPFGNLIIEKNENENDSRRTDLARMLYDYSVGTLCEECYKNKAMTSIIQDKEWDTFKRVRHHERY
jgi:hypothetical protein